MFLHNVLIILAYFIGVGAVMVFFAGLGWLIWNVETWTYRLVKSRIVSYSAMMLTGIGIFALATALLGVKL